MDGIAMPKRRCCSLWAKHEVQSVESWSKVLSKTCSHMFTRPLVPNDSRKSKMFSQNLQHITDFTSTKRETKTHLVEEETPHSSNERLSWLFVPLQLEPGDQLLWKKHVGVSWRCVAVPARHAFFFRRSKTNCCASLWASSKVSWLWSWDVTALKHTGRPIWTPYGGLICRHCNPFVF